MHPEHPTGILADNHASEPYADLAARFKLKLLLFTPEGIDWKTHTAAGFYLTKHGVHFKRLPLPRVIYNRLYPHNQQLISRLNSLLPPIRVFSQITQLDKWIVYKMLAASVLADHLPQTYEYDITTLHHALLEHGDIVIKPRLGRQGSGLWRLQLCLVAGCWSNQPCPCRLRCPIQRQSSMFSYPDGSLYNGCSRVCRSAVVDGCRFDLRALVQKNRYGRWRVTALTARIARRISISPTTTKKWRPQGCWLPTTFR